MNVQAGDRVDVYWQRPLYHSTATINKQRSGVSMAGITTAGQLPRFDATGAVEAPGALFNGNGAAGVFVVTPGMGSHVYNVTIENLEIYGATRDSYYWYGTSALNYYAGTAAV